MESKYSNLFRSRWKALWWAGGVLLTAYCTVPSPEDSAPAAKAGAAHHQSKAHSHNELKELSRQINKLNSHPEPPAKKWWAK